MNLLADIKDAIAKNGVAARLGVKDEVLACYLGRCLDAFFQALAERPPSGEPSEAAETPKPKPKPKPSDEVLMLLDRLRQYILARDPDSIDMHGKRWSNTKYRWLASLEKNNGLFRDVSQLTRAIDHLEAWRDDEYCPTVNSISQLITKLGSIREHALRNREKAPRKPREPSWDVAGTPTTPQEIQRAREAAVSPEHGAASARAVLESLGFSERMREAAEQEEPPSVANGDSCPQPEDEEIF